MVELVEGEWKNFVFKMLSVEDTENKRKVFDHLRNNFYQDETICRYFGGCEEDGAQELEAFYDTVIPHNLSFFAVDKDTNEIAGVRMTFVQTRTTDFSKLICNSKTVSAMFKVCADMDKEANFMDRMGIDEFINFVTASVDKIHRGKGLATEMYKRSLQLLKAKKGSVYVKSVLTSEWTRKALANLGFKELFKKFYKDFKDDNGQDLFPNMREDSFCNFMFIKL